MRSFWRRLALTFVVTATAAGVLRLRVAQSAGRQGGQGPVRQVVRSADIRLADVVRPGELELVVGTRESPPLQVQPPPGVSLTDWLIQLHAIPLIVSIDGIAPRLTQAGDFVESVI